MYAPEDSRNRIAYLSTGVIWKYKIRIHSSSEIVENFQVKTGTVEYLAFQGRKLLLNFRYFFPLCILLQYKQTKGSNYKWNTNKQTKLHLEIVDALINT